MCSSARALCISVCMHSFAYVWVHIYMCVSACGDLGLTSGAVIYRSSTSFLKIPSPGQTQSLLGQLVSPANVLWGFLSPPSEVYCSWSSMISWHLCGFLGSELWPSQLHCKPLRYLTHTHFVSLKLFYSFYFYLCSMCVPVWVHVHHMRLEDVFGPLGTGIYK